MHIAPLMYFKIVIVPAEAEERCTILVKLGVVFTFQGFVPPSVCRSLTQQIKVAHD